LRKGDGRGEESGRRRCFIAAVSPPQYAPDHVISHSVMNQDNHHPEKKQQKNKTEKTRRERTLKKKEKEKSSKEE